MKLRLLVLCVLCASTRLAVAQGGCVNSPENPTLVLAAMGVAAAAVSRLRKR